jgi:hypothetical protein
MTSPVHNGGAGWHPFGLTDQDFDQAHERAGVRWINVKLGNGDPDRAATWLRGALAGLAVLAVAAAVVSWDAQYVMVASIKHYPAIAGLEAGIPDVGALIFAALGIALAMHGKRAIRARGLNLACVSISLAMNALAATPRWRDLAVWIMPSAVYALASDTFIGVVRARALARRRDQSQTLAADEATPLAVLGGIVLWTLRFVFAPLSTVAGFRRWVVEECPVAPGRRALTQPRQTPALAPAQDSTPPPADGAPNRRRRSRPGKQDRLLALAARRHDLRTLPLAQVSGIANAIGAEVDLSRGTARRVLLAHVRALQNGSTPAQETTS